MNLSERQTGVLFFFFLCTSMEMVSSLTLPFRPRQQQQTTTPTPSQAPPLRPEALLLSSSFFSTMTRETAARNAAAAVSFASSTSSSSTISSSSQLLLFSRAASSKAAASRAAAAAGLKVYKPTTPGMRGRVITSRQQLWKGSPHKQLVSGGGRSGGRNATGQVTVRHRGGGHRAVLRAVDFWRVPSSSKSGNGKGGSNGAALENSR